MHLSVSAELHSAVAKRQMCTPACLQQPIHKNGALQEDIFHAIKAIVATQRDYGRRDDRKQVRHVGCRSDFCHEKEDQHGTHVLVAVRM